jgi:hypothetical protein
MSEASLQKARDFAEAGGLVIATGQLPFFADTEKSNETVRKLVRDLFGVEPVNHVPKFGMRLIGSDDRDIDPEVRKIFDAEGKYISRAVGRKGGRAIYIPAITPALIEKALAECAKTQDVSFEGVSPEIKPKGVFGYTHKVMKGLDIYLFANSTDGEVKAKVTIRGKFNTLESWDPMTGEIGRILIKAANDAKGAKVTEAELVLKPLTDVFWVGRM